MVRADYGGDGLSSTRDGTQIMFCDRAGIHPCPGAEHALEAAWFEAAWSEGGAVCVVRPRIPDLVSLSQLEDRYPRLAGHLGPACTTTDPQAVLFNWVRR